jgi:hypothetical protein
MRLINEIYLSAVVHSVSKTTLLQVNSYLSLLKYEYTKFEKPALELMLCVAINHYNKAV